MATVIGKTGVVDYNDELILRTEIVLNKLLMLEKRVTELESKLCHNNIK